MPKASLSVRKTSLNSVEQYELYQWLEQNHVNSNNLRRSFTDVLPLARLLAKYYPELIDLNYYPPRNSVHNKLCNWESFNKRVLGRLGMNLTRDQMVRVARSVPGSVDLLLYNIMRIQLTAEQKARAARHSSDDDDDDADDDADAAAPAVAVPNPPAAAAAAAATAAMPAKQVHDESTDVVEQAKQSKLVDAKPNTVMSKTLKQTRAGNIAGTARTTRGTALQGRTNNANKKLAATINEDISPISTSTQQRGELTSELPKQRTVLYSTYMQAVNQLQRKDAKIARFDQLSAHLENMLQLKCDRIDELQQQVAFAVECLKS